MATPDERDDILLTPFVVKARKPVTNIQPAQTQRDVAFGSGATSGTWNTTHIQDTGLGPSNLDPALDDSSSDPNRRPSPFIEIGSSGLAQYGGFVRDEFLPQLQGERGLRTFREMFENDPIVGALVFAVQMLLRKVQWRVEPPEAPTVEGIVAARQKERVQMLRARREEQTNAQAALAAKPGTGAHSQPPPAGTGASGQPQPSLAAPQHESTTPFHEPLPEFGGYPTSHAAPSPHPSSVPPVRSTPAPDRSQVTSGHGSNPVTRPHTNAPVSPNTPTSNPGGGPAQDAALAGHDGLPGARPLRKSAEQTFEEWWSEVSKASTGQFIGPIDAEPVGDVPDDPETHEPMDFLVGTDPLSPPSAAEIHAQELAVFVETCLHDMADPWSDLISQIITMIVFGFAYHEIVYKKRNGPNPDDPVQGSRYADGKIGWAKIAGRAQETVHRWEFDEFGNVLGMWQLAPPKYQLKYIPMAKALLFRTTGYKNNPMGRSILRSAYRPWYFKRRIEEMEAIGVERNLAGLPVMYVPGEWFFAGATDEQKASLEEAKTIVRNVRQNDQAGLVLPTFFDPETKQRLLEVTLLTGGGGAGSKVQDTDKIISRYDQRIAMVALVDFILLGHESVGSKSLADTKADLFTTALEAWLSSIADVINTYAIPRLMQINGEDPAMSPRLTFGKLTTVSIMELSQLLTALGGAGFDIAPDAVLEDYIRSVAGMPPKQATDDL